MESMDLKSKGDAMARFFDETCCSVLMTSNSYVPWSKDGLWVMVIHIGNHYHPVGSWALPLWKNDGVRQLGLWHSQLNGKIKALFQTTNQSWVYESLLLDSQPYPQYWQSAPLSTTLILTIFSIINHPFWITNYSTNYPPIYGNLHIRIYLYIYMYIYIYGSIVESPWIYTHDIPVKFPSFATQMPQTRHWMKNNSPVFRHVTSLVTAGDVATRLVPMDCKDNFSKLFKYIIQYG